MGCHVGGSNHFDAATERFKTYRNASQGRSPFYIDLVEDRKADCGSEPTLQVCSVSTQKQASLRSMNTTITVRGH